MNNNLTTNASNEAENPAFLVGAVSSSSLSDWRNDEYSEEEFDEDDFEETHGNSEAEHCTCGAYKWSNGRWLHVSDCCC